MKEIFTRSFTGIIYILLLLVSFRYQEALIVLFFVFGIISIFELSKLIHLKGYAAYALFIILFTVFVYGNLQPLYVKEIDAATQIFLVITLFMQLFLIKDLFSKTLKPFFKTKKLLITTFYTSSAFIFLVLIGNYYTTFNSHILLGSFILIWVNDSFAYLVGKNFGKQKLFEKISPKKTVEGFLGGLLFSCIASYFIATFTQTLTFTSWLILSVIISVFGTIGDLIESKFKRQAQVKDSGKIMPGHGGLLDRLDSIIFAGPFIYLFLRILQYVS